MRQPLVQTLQIPIRLFTDLIEEAGRAFPLETGGILLGRQLGGVLVVTDIVGPGPGATHRARSFTPDRDWQYGRLDALWAAALGQLAYLGDWHTHPHGKPNPSTTDETLLRRTAANPACQCAQPVMLILARSDTDNHWVAGAHQYRAGGWIGPLGTTRGLRTEIVSG